MQYEGMTARVVGYIRDSFGVEPEYLWADSDTSAALRHHADKKWFGVLMTNMLWRRLGVDREGCVDILNVKCDPVLVGSLVDGRSILPGYHMNKQHWISLVLDETAQMEKLIFLIDASYAMTLKKAKKKARSSL